MNITVDQLFQQIGRLLVENLLLNQTVAEQQSQIAALKDRPEPPKGE